MSKNMTQAEAQLAQLAVCKAAWASHKQHRTSETLKLWRLNCEMLMVVGEPKPAKAAKTTPAPTPVVATPTPKKARKAKVETVVAPAPVEVEAEYVNPEIF